MGGAGGRGELNLREGSRVMEMLTPSQQQNLLRVLSDGNAKFEDSLNRFKELFTMPRCFRALWVIQHLIEQQVLPRSDA